MSGWIKFEKDLLTDPRILRIARSLSDRWKLDEVIVASPEFEIGNASALPAVTLVCGALVRIWSLADTHIGPDNVLPLGIDELNEVVGIPGFCELLPADWLAPIDDYSVELPEYHAHNGTEAKKRAVTQKRVSRHRARALQGGNGRALPDLDQDQDLDLDLKEKPMSGKPDVSPQFREKAKGLLVFLNTKTQRNFHPVEANLKFLTALLKSGVSEDDIRSVVAKKCREWTGNEKMAPYLRPATLFNSTKFAQYHGELIPEDRLDAQ